jgi:hypothetical protein
MALSFWTCMLVYVVHASPCACDQHSCTIIMHLHKYYCTKKNYIYSGINKGIFYTITMEQRCGKGKKHIAWILHKIDIILKLLNQIYNTIELGSINTKEYEETHNDDKGKKHITWIEIILNF